MCRLFLQTACIQMQIRYDFEDKVMMLLPIFNPSEAKAAKTRTTHPSLQPISVLLPRCLQDLKMQDIDNEWRSISFVEFPDEILEGRGGFF